MPSPSAGSTCTACGGMVDRHMEKMLKFKGQLGILVGNDTFTNEVGPQELD